MNLISVAKAIGFLAFGVTCAGYLSKDDDRLRLAVAVSAGMLSMHYFMLGVWVSGASLAVNFARNQLAIRKKGFVYFATFGVLQIAIGVVLYKTPQDILPVVGSLLSGYALFCASGVRLRMLMLLCTAMWFVNNFTLLSYGAMLQDGLSMVMNIIGIVKLRSQAKAEVRS